MDRQTAFRRATRLAIQSGEERFVVFVPENDSYDVATAEDLETFYVGMHPNYIEACIAPDGSVS